MHIISEEKSVSGVTRVILREYGQLFIGFGEEESLRIEGQEALTRMVRTDVRGKELLIDLDGGWWDRTWRALTSTVEGKPLKYFLTLKKLEGLFVTGAARVQSKRIVTDSLQVILKGAGEIILSDLDTQKLDVELPGAGVISVSGKATEQFVFLKGAGSYDAPRLQSEVARVRLHGVGKAAVWVSRSLDAEVDGVGKIEYYGHPDVRRSVSGLGKIQQVGH